MTATKVLPRAEVNMPLQDLDSLTEREFQVLALIASGHSNRSIGNRLSIMEKSVENYANHIYLKLGIENDDNTFARVKAALMYREKYQFGFVKEKVDADLKPREYEVLSLLARGYSNAEIARELCIMNKSVQNYINRIHSKLGIYGLNSSYTSRVLAMLMFDRIPAPNGYTPRT